MIALAVAALLVAGTGCKPKVEFNAELTASAGGRDIKALVVGGAFVHPTAEAFTVSFTGHKVVIEKERVLLDAKELAKFPATATKFELVCTNATLRITADGAEVLATMITK